MPNGSAMHARLPSQSAEICGMASAGTVNEFGVALAIVVGVTTLRARWVGVIGLFAASVVVGVLLLNMVV